MEPLALDRVATPEDGPDEPDGFDEFEPFDVQAWADAYHADDEIEKKFPPALAGVPFH